MDPNKSGPPNNFPGSADRLRQMWMQENQQKKSFTSDYPPVSHFSSRLVRINR